LRAGRGEPPLRASRGDSPGSHTAQRESRPDPVSATLWNIRMLRGEGFRFFARSVEKLKEVLTGRKRHSGTTSLMDIK